MVALMVSIAVNAAPSALYLIGTLTGANWDKNKTDYPFESKGNGVFVYDKVLDGTNGEQWFRLYDGTQEYAPEKDGNEVKMDSSWPLKQTNSGAFKIASKVTKLTVVFDENGKGTVYGGDAPTEPVIPPTPEEKEYTVYFYDTQSWTLNIWAWTEGGNNYTGGDWNSRPTMTLTGLKYKNGDTVYDVYSYTFKTTDELTDNSQLIIGTGEKNDPTRVQAQLFDKAIYSNSGLIAKDGEFDFYVEPTVDPYDVTFYYINKGYANGWECPEAHVFAGEASQDVPGVKTNDRYKDPQDGNIYDVIKYVFTANKEISKYQLCFKVGTSYSGSNFALKKGALYCTVAIANENPSWYIAGEDTSSKTIYFNMGADYMLDEDKWVVNGKKIAPYAIFQNKAGEWSMKKQMEKVDGEDCMYKVTFDASMYKSVKFSNDKSGAELLEYPIDSEVALNHNKELAGEGWYTYIYVADGDFVDETKTHRYWATQSWLPFDEYLKLRDGVRTQYCVASSVTDWHKNAYKVKMNPEEGVCLFETESLTPGTKFKLSYIVPFDNNQVANGHTGDDANIQRWWATFNLGIVGPEVSDATQDGSNKYVSYELRKPKRYNHYCKYDWNVAYKASEVPDGSKVYVIIDPKHQTTTLITFNPQPKLNKVEVGTITAKHLDEYENVEVTEVGSNIKGKDVHGEARVRKVNNLLTTAMIYPSPMPEEFYNMYQVKYTVYQNGEPVATFLRKDLENLDSSHKGTTDGQKWYKVDLSSLAPGTSDVVSFDATYTLKKDDGSLTDLMFGSKVHTQTATANTKYPEFTEAKVLAHYATPSYRDDATGEMVWDAIVKVKFTLEGETGGNTYVYYPEVEATTAEGLQGYIADIKNRYYSDFHRAKYDWKDVNGNDYTPHTKYDGTSEYNHDINNWSIIAREAGVFHIYLPGVGRTVGDYKNPGKLAEFTFDLNLTAAYPFLVDKMTNTYQELRAPKRAEELAATTPKDVVFQRRTLSLNDIQVNVDNIGTSGINDVDIDAIEGEGELYNLQGVRVYGEPTPGIYLRRQGNQVVKVAIR